MQMTLASYGPIPVLLTLIIISELYLKFQKNLLSLNFTKTQFTNLTTKNNNQIEINTG
jgi:hypothetical protein